MAEETFEIAATSAAAIGSTLTQALNPRSVKPGAPAAPAPDDTWKLDGGQAWVWRVPGNQTLTKPVIIADGFSAGASMLDEWAGLWAQSQISEIHPWGTQLHGHGRDVIVLGYDSRSVAIRDNAHVATECITKASAERSGDAPLVVGGLSMGGLVTRYALARMEMQRIDHEVDTYFSFDSPHRGAWIPISLQVFAHFLAGLAALIPDTPENSEKKKQLSALSELMNSPASRELVWKHTATHKNLDSQFGPDPAREAFVEELEAMGSYPTRPRKLAVANGRGDRQGSPMTEDVPNLVWPRKPAGLVLGPGATLYSQSPGTDKLVATLHGLGTNQTTVKTSDIPALDGAHGGTLNSFGIAAQALRDAGYDATAAIPDVCFVPVASAVDLADPSDPHAAVNEMDPAGSGLDEYMVASQNEPHTLLTEELCSWLTERF